MIDFGIDFLAILAPSWVLLWLLGCLRGVVGASWRRFGTVWSGSWVPTWVPTWSQLGQKIDPKIDHFWDASWDLFLDGFLWILGAQMEPSWHQNGIKNRCLLGRAIFQNSCSGCSAGGPQRVPHRTVRWGTRLWRLFWEVLGFVLGCFGPILARVWRLFASMLAPLQVRWGTPFWVDF